MVLVKFLARFHVLPLLTPILFPGHRPLKGETVGSILLRPTNVYGRQNRLRNVAGQPLRKARPT